MTGRSSKVVLVTGTSLVPEAARDYMESRGYQVRYIAQDAFTPEELTEALAGVSGYLIGGYEEPLASHFEAATKLEAVAWVGTDYKAYVPGWQRAFELGIAFLNSPGTNAVSVAEFTALLMLSLFRPFTARIVRGGEPISDLSAPGHDLYHHRLGVIGLGRIGSRLARIARLGFEMEVVYSGPNRHESLEHALGIEYVDRDVLLSSSDVISLHRPSPQTGDKYELGQREFSLMKDGAVVINTVHPQLIDFAALAWAIEAKGIRAAQDGVASGDAWEKVLALGPEKFLAVPSMAFNTQDANLRASMRTAEGVCDVLDGGTSPDVNNPDFRKIRHAR